MVAGSVRHRGKTPTEPTGSGSAAGLGVTPAEKVKTGSAESKYVINLPTGGCIILYWNEYGERGASFRGIVPYEIRELVFDELRLHLKPRVEILENEIKNIMKRWLENE